MDTANARRRRRLLFACSVLVAAALGGSLFWPQCRRVEQPAARFVSRPAPSTVQGPASGLDSDGRGLRQHERDSMPSVSAHPSVTRGETARDPNTDRESEAAAVTEFDCYTVRVNVDVGTSGLPSTNGRNEFVIRLSGSSGGGVEFEAKNGVPVEKDIYGTRGEEWVAQAWTWTWTCAEPVAETTFVTRITDAVLEIDLTLDGPLGEWTCVFPRRPIHEDQAATTLAQRRWAPFVMGGQAIGSIAPDGPDRWNPYVYMRNDASDLRGVCGTSGVTLFLLWGNEYLMTCETLQMGEVRALPAPPQHPILVELPLVSHDWCDTIEIVPGAAHAEAMSHFGLDLGLDWGKPAGEEDAVIDVGYDAVTLPRPKRRSSVRIAAWIPYVVRCREAAGSTFYTVAEFDPKGADPGGELVLK